MNEEILLKYSLSWPNLCCYKDLLIFSAAIYEDLPPFNVLSANLGGLGI
jgi:hypothetical protein